MALCPVLPQRTENGAIFHVMTIDDGVEIFHVRIGPGFHEDTASLVVGTVPCGVQVGAVIGGIYGGIKGSQKHNKIK